MGVTKHRTSPKYWSFDFATVSPGRTMTLTALLVFTTLSLRQFDRLIPKHSVTCRRRSSDPWFDQECREAKRRVHGLERVSSRASSVATISVTMAAATAWTAERCAYHDLLFWRTKIDAERSVP